MRGGDLKNFIYKTDCIKLLMDSIKQLIDMDDEYNKQKFYNRPQMSLQQRAM